MELKLGADLYEESNEAKVGGWFIWDWEVLEVRIGGGEGCFWETRV